MCSAFTRVFTVAMMLLPLWTLQAGRFYADFNSGQPSGTRIGGEAMINPGAGVDDSGMLRLTAPERDRRGSFIVENFDRNKKIAGFVVDFKVLIGGGSSRGADGLSFNFARDLPLTMTEVGAGKGLVVMFDTYQESGGAPEIVVKYRNQPVKTVQVAKLRTGNAFVEVQIKLTPDNRLAISYAGRSVLECEIPDYKPMNGAEFGFGARTGSAFDSHLIDELKIVTTLVGPTALQGTPPAAPDPES